MTFTHPLALWLALLIPVVVFAFFIRRKLRRRRVPALFLWEEALGKTFAKARSFKVRNLLALIVAAVITAALVGSVAEPVAGGSDADATVVVFDNSASMNALEKGDVSRLELARTELERLVYHKSEESEILVITTAGAPTVLAGYTRDAAALRKTAAEIEPTELPSAMPESLELARTFAQTRGKGARVLVLSDGCFDGADGFLASLQATDSIQFRQIGGPLDNVAVETFQARRSPIGDAAYETTLEVVNYGAKSVSFDVEIGLNDTLVDLVPMTLEPNARDKRTLKYESTEGGTLSARVLIDDAAANRKTQDDVKLADLPDFPRMRVLLYGTVDRFLQAVFAAQPNVETERVSEIPDALEPDALLVICGDVPETLPKGKVALVNPTSGANLFAVGDEEYETAVEPGVVDSPLTCFLNFDGVALRGARDIVPFEGVAVETYARTPEAPAIFAARDPDLPDSPRWVYNFSCAADSIVLRTLFPIIFANLVGASRGIDDSNYASAQVLPDAEFNLRAPADGKTSAALGASGGRITLWRFFAAVAFLLAGLEYYWYCRRRV